MDGRGCRESARRTARRSNDHSRRLFLCNRSRDSKSRRSTRLPSASPLYYPEQNVNITYNHVGGEDKLRGGSGAVTTFARDLGGCPPKQREVISCRQSTLHGVVFDIFGWE